MRCIWRGKVRALRMMAENRPGARGTTTPDTNPAGETEERGGRYGGALWGSAKDGGSGGPTEREMHGRSPRRAGGRKPM